ncbi:Reticulon-3 [Intoshia linei]|uniref:Reticulon-like protein n=1 Tax=Intoshia linei TaxID=1819745 RepID=A0A177B0G7_9BILA|nr:Reticulon-3 [Intoshia linei]
MDNLSMAEKYDSTNSDNEKSTTPIRRRNLSCELNYQIESTVETQELNDSMCVQFYKCIPTCDDLIHWKDFKITLGVYGSAIILYLSLSSFSVISITSYLFGFLLLTTCFCRVYTTLSHAYKKEDSAHCFERLLIYDFKNIENYLLANQDVFRNLILTIFLRLRDIIFVKHWIETLKYILLCYIMSYVGSWFNALTLLFLVVTSVFVLPVFYTNYKDKLSKIIDVAMNKAKSIFNRMKSQIAKKPKKTTSKKDK